MAKKEKRVSCQCIANVDGLCAVEQCNGEIRGLDIGPQTLLQARDEYMATSRMFEALFPSDIDKKDD